MILIFISAIAIGEGNGDVTLVDWKATQCDHKPVPRDFVNKITEMSNGNGVTNITVNFATNCCVPIDPWIEFADGKLQLKFYKEYDEGELCFCQCCFTIEYQIKGLLGKKYEIFFNDAKIDRLE